MTRARTHLLSAWQEAGRRAVAQEGVVMVFAMVLMLIGLAVGAAALAETLSSRSHADRDTRSLRALQAADFGVQAVLYRENQLNLDSLDLMGGKGVLGKIPDCVIPLLSKDLNVKASVTVAVSESGVSGNATVSACPIAEREGPKGREPWKDMPVGNHDSYQAEFVPGERVVSGSSGVTFEPKILAIGKDELPSDPTHAVYARVEANLAPVDPFKTVEAVHDLTFTVPVATTFSGTARAGGSVTFKTSIEKTVGSFTGSNLLGSGGNVIGPATIDYGCNKSIPEIAKLPSVTITGVEFYPVPEGLVGKCPPKPFFTRSAISVSASKANCSSSCAGLTGYVSGRNGEEAADSSKSNEDEIFNTNALAAVELTAGTDYVFCSFVTNGPVVLKGASASSLPVRVFIDSPSSTRCKGFQPHKGLKAGETVKAGSFNATQGVGGGGTTLSPTQMQIYLVGDGTNGGTSFTSSGATSGLSALASGFFLYAPQSEVTVKAMSFTGLLLGYNVNVEATAFTQNLGLNDYPLSSTAGVFHVTGYTQCSLTNSSGKAVTQLGTTSAAEDSSGC